MRSPLTKTNLALIVAVVALAVPAVAVATHVFDDVADDRFFADAVEWAAANEITTGTSATTFDPERGVTRGESVTFLQRYNDNVVQPSLPVAYHALVDATGAIEPGTTDGVSVGKGATGIFEVELPTDDVRGCAWQATLVLGSDEDFLLIAPSPSPGEIALAQDFDAPPGPSIGVDVDPDSILVRTWDSTGSPADQPFHLTVIC